ALAQAPNIAGAYEAAMDTASKQLRSLSRDTTEVAEAFGEHLTPALNAGVGALRDVLKWMRDLPDPIQSTAVQLGVAAAALSSFLGA
ncbi:MAG: phage tail tape measure protein, partial [Anaerolineae bacterium]|nr:phage tail tape measure protein [Anaerolineae bacterium]